MGPREEVEVCFAVDEPVFIRATDVKLRIREGRRPVVQGGVVVRVGDHNSGETAQFVDLGDGVSVQ